MSSQEAFLVLKKQQKLNGLKNHAKLIHSELIIKEKIPFNKQSFFDFDPHRQSLWKIPLTANTLFIYRPII